MRRNLRVEDSSTSEDLLLLLDIPHQVRLVGVAVLTEHPTVELDAYRLFEGGNALV